jgi:hypothetical protein
MKPPSVTVADNVGYGFCTGNGQQRHRWGMSHRFGRLKTVTKAAIGASALD